MQKTVHIIGAGISGLAAAVRLANANYKVHLHEATQQAGGRCRSEICYRIRLNQSIDSIPDTSASAAAAAAKNAVTSVSLCSKKSFVFKLL